MDAVTELAACRCDPILDRMFYRMFYQMICGSVVASGHVHYAHGVSVSGAVTFVNAACAGQKTDMAHEPIVLELSRAGDSSARLEVRVVSEDEPQPTDVKTIVPTDCPPGAGTPPYDDRMAYTISDAARAPTMPAAVRSVVSRIFGC